MGSEQPDRVKDGPAHCVGGWTRWPLKVPSTPSYDIKTTSHLWYLFAGDMVMPRVVLWQTPEQEPLSSSLPAVL